MVKNGVMPSAPSVSSSITVRMQVEARPTAVSELTTSIEQSGGIVTALDVTASGHERITVDVTCATRGEEHANEIVTALRAHPGVVVDRVSDRTFLLHLGGKLSIESKVPLRNRDDLSMAYTPGVARICEAIAARPEDARRLGPAAPAAPGGRDVYVYFDNDVKVRAPVDAMALAARLGVGPSASCYP